MSGKYQTWDVFNHLVVLLFAIDFSLLLYLPRDRSMIRQDKGWGTLAQMVFLTRDIANKNFDF